MKTTILLLFFACLGYGQTIIQNNGYIGEIIEVDSMVFVEITNDYAIHSGVHITDHGGDEIWVNFTEPVTQTFTDSLAIVRGVETSYKWSRYSIKLTIGSAFNRDRVIQDVLRKSEKLIFN